MELQVVPISPHSVRTQPRLHYTAHVSTPVNKFRTALGMVYVDQVCKFIYTHGNKLGNTCNNVTTNFGLNISFFVRIMKNDLTT